jgi:hypothetical protein
MGLQSLERSMERMVEGVFARAFRSKLRPIELGRKMVRDMDANRTVDVQGRVVVPNSFSFSLSPDDHGQFTEIHDALVRELADAAREYARDENYTFMGPVDITITVDATLKTGRFNLDTKMHERRGGVGAGALVMANGDRVTLGTESIIIGRLPDCGLTLADPNVSRQHAEIRPSGTGYVIEDRGSTNGTKVNGSPISSHRLRDGDEIGIGTARIRFEAS